jgi:predicted permease
MGKTQKLGWRNIASGLISLAIGAIPLDLFVLLNSRYAPAQQTLGTLGFLLAIVLIFGVGIGLLVELVFVPRLKPKNLMGKTLGIYLAVGWVVAFAYFGIGFLPSLFQSSGSEWSPMTQVGFLLIAWVYAGFVYSVVAVISRSAYPLVHRLIFGKPINSTHDQEPGVQL